MSTYSKSAPNVHSLTVGRGPGPRGDWGICPPQIRITGPWLIDYGFTAGQRVTVLAVPGRLVVIHHDHMPLTDSWQEAMARQRLADGCCCPCCSGRRLMLAEGMPPGNK